MRVTPDWQAIQTKWEAGTDEQTLSSAYGIKLDSLRKRASRNKWDRTNRPVGADRPKASKRPKSHTRTHEAPPKSNAVAEVLPAKSVASLLRMVDNPDDFNEQHMADYQAARETAVKLLANLGKFEDAVVPRMLTAITGALKIVQDGQRKALSMDAKANNSAGDLEAALAELDSRGAVLLPIKQGENGPELVEESGK